MIHIFKIKRILFNVISLFSFFAWVSCNDDISIQQAKDKLQAFLHVPISDSIEITAYKIEGSVQGANTESFIVHLKETEFSDIFRKVNPERMLYTDSSIYGYSVDGDGNEKMTSAIFNCNEHTINYVRSY